MLFCYENLNVLKTVCFIMYFVRLVKFLFVSLFVNFLFSFCKICVQVGLVKKNRHGKYEISVNPESIRSHSTQEEDIVANWLTTQAGGSMTNIPLMNHIWNTAFSFPKKVQLQTLNLQTNKFVFENQNTNFKLQLLYEIEMH